MKHGCILERECWAKEDSHQRTHTIWFHLHKNTNLCKRSGDKGYLGEKGESGRGHRAGKAFRPSGKIPFLGAGYMGVFSLWNSLSWALLVLYGSSKCVLYSNKKHFKTLYMSYPFIVYPSSELWGGSCQLHEVFTLHHVLCWFSIIFQNHTQSLSKWPRLLDQESGLNIVAVSLSQAPIKLAENRTLLKNKEGSQPRYRYFEVSWEIEHRLDWMDEKDEKSRD